MDLHSIGAAGAIAVGVGRSLTGVYLLARPEDGARSWVGDTSTPATYLTRGIGARDLAIGGGVLWALATDNAPAAWVLASVVGDVSDAVFAMGMLDQAHRTRAIALAGGFALLGVATAAALLT